MTIAPLLFIAAIMSNPLPGLCSEDATAEPVNAEPMIGTRGMFRPAISSKPHRDPDTKSTIRFKIDVNGKATDICILNQSGSRGLDVAAALSVKNSTFQATKSRAGVSYYLVYYINDWH